MHKLALNRGTIAMKYERIEPQLDLNDPVEGFSVSSADDPSTLVFTDWRGRKITFYFYTTYLISHRISNGYRGLPEGGVVEILESTEIQSLRESCTASKEEPLHHYVISTNEDDWCEVIAARYELAE